MHLLGGKTVNRKSKKLKMQEKASERRRNRGLSTDGSINLQARQGFFSSEAQQEDLRLVFDRDKIETVRSVCPEVSYERGLIFSEHNASR